MKKLFILFLFLSVSAAALTACTEEEVKPSKETGNAGGVPIKE